VTAGVVSYMLQCGGGGFAGLVSLTSFPYSLELLVPGRGFSASRVLLCVHRLGAFGFLWDREQVCEM
jgi:hypothetical protein